MPAGSNEIWQLLGRQRRSLVLVVGCFDSVLVHRKRHTKKSNGSSTQKKSNHAKIQVQVQPLNPQSQVPNWKPSTQKYPETNSKLDIRYLNFCCHQSGASTPSSTHSKRDGIRCPHQQLKYSFQLLCTLVIF